MVGLCNIVNGVLTGAAVSRGWEGAVSCQSILDHFGDVVGRGHPDE